jgi:hypothetical protein
MHQPLSPSLPFGLWLLGFLASWLLGFLASWLLGFLASNEFILISNLYESDLTPKCR